MSSSKAISNTLILRHKMDFIQSLKFPNLEITQNIKLGFEYDNSKNKYLELYKQYILNTYTALKYAFPDIDFDFDIRIKSKKSYINKKLKSTNENIKDLLGCKIIIYSKNGIKDENTLIDSAYEISEFLENYNSSNDITICKKDYIKNPKESGYQSIHLCKNSNINNINFNNEFQIKTFMMHEQEKNGKYAHSGIYKQDRKKILNENNINEYLPIYLKINQDKHSKLFKINNLSFIETFEKFFDIPYSEYIKNPKLKKIESR